MHGHRCHGQTKSHDAVTSADEASQYDCFGPDIDWGSDFDHHVMLNEEPGCFASGVRSCEEGGVTSSMMGLVEKKARGTGLSR